MTLGFMVESGMELIVRYLHWDFYDKLALAFKTIAYPLIRAEYLTALIDKV